MARRLSDAGMRFSQMGAAGGDASRGEKGLVALPGREGEFRDALRRALDYAEAIGCPLVHPMAGVVTGADTGDRDRDRDRDYAEATYRANLGYAVEECRGRPLSILIEAISDKVVPGYFVSRLDQALRLADTVAPGEITLLADSFHAASDGIDLKAFVAAHAGRIGHVHIADFPGRHEPGSGGLDFAELLKTLVHSGYKGAIGFEYVPSRPTDETLGWMPSWKTLLQAEGKV
jgi:hydroxypyruvate isomerase